MVRRRGAELTLPPPPSQISGRQKVEASLRQLERERALLQHQSAENLRKVEMESDRKRSLENEREPLGNPSRPHSGRLNSRRSIQKTKSIWLLIVSLYVSQK